MAACTAGLERQVLKSNILKLINFSLGAVITLAWSLGI